MELNSNLESGAACGQSFLVMNAGCVVLDASSILDIERLLICLSLAVIPVYRLVYDYSIQVLCRYSTKAEFCRLILTYRHWECFAVNLLLIVFRVTVKTIKFGCDWNWTFDWTWFPRKRVPRIIILPCLHCTPHILRNLLQTNFMFLREPCIIPRNR